MSKIKRFLKWLSSGLDDETSYRIIANQMQMEGYTEHEIYLMYGHLLTKPLPAPPVSEQGEKENG